MSQSIVMSWFATISKNKTLNIKNFRQMSFKVKAIKAI